MSRFRISECGWVLITVAAAALFGLTWRLGDVVGFVFDEGYYIPEARDVLLVGTPTTFSSHPPFGRQLLAGSIRLFGDDPVGWRLVSVVAGIATATVAAWLVAQRVGNRDHATGGTAATRRLAAGCVGVVLLTDGLFVSMSRTGMLDAPLMALSLVAVTLAWLAAEPRRSDNRLVLLTATGLICGIALATKWTAGAALAVAALVAGPSRRGAFDHRWIVAGLAVVTYLLTWAPWLAHFPYTDHARELCATAPEDCSDWSVGDRLSHMVGEHADMLALTATLDNPHSMGSRVWEWSVGWQPLLLEDDACDPSAALLDAPWEVRDTIPAGTTAFLEETDPRFGRRDVCPTGAKRRLVGTLANPVLWWGWLIVLPSLAGLARQRDRLAFVALSGWAAFTLPWLATTRTQYLFYVLPALPFMAVGLVHVLRSVSTRAIFKGFTRCVAAAAPLAILGTFLPTSVAAQPLLFGWAGWMAAAFAPREAPEAPDATPTKQMIAVALAAGLFSFATLPLATGAALDQDDPRVTVFFDIVLRDLREARARTEGS